MSDDETPDPGRRLMFVALIGVAVLAIGVIAAATFFVWSRLQN
jgi:hypothetical protein